ncbi:unnamed protein product, partial [Meganyctiphanes norvegica]
MGGINSNRGDLGKFVEISLMDDTTDIVVPRGVMQWCSAVGPKGAMLQWYRDKKRHLWDEASPSHYMAYRLLFGISLILLIALIVICGILLIQG